MGNPAPWNALVRAEKFEAPLAVSPLLLPGRRLVFNGVSVELQAQAQCELKQPHTSE
jgi:hypothetical protein